MQEELAMENIRNNARHSPKSFLKNNVSKNQDRTGRDRTGPDRIGQQQSKNLRNLKNPEI